MGVPLLAIGGGTTAIGIGASSGPSRQQRHFRGMQKGSPVNSLKAINGVSWGLTGVGLGITAFGVLELSKGKTVSVAAGPRSITIFGRW